MKLLLGLLIVLVAALAGGYFAFYPAQQWTDGVPDFGVGEIDPQCRSKEKWYFRTYDGSCNWVKKGQANIGTAGQPFGRERPAHFKEKTFNLPRDGPNPREVSNVFFDNRLTRFWDHTAFLTAYAELLMHDWVHAPRSTDPADLYNMPLPRCDKIFDLNCQGGKTFTFWRTKSVQGTGGNTPRENPNDQTAWLDLSALYGTNKETTDKLRTFVDGKLKTSGSYLPWAEDVGVDVYGPTGAKLFAAGDPRVNQDYLVATLTNLFLLEHNRLCIILKAQFPEFDDEHLFLAARTVLSAKFAMLGESFLQSFFARDINITPGYFVWSTWLGEPVWEFVLSLIKYPYQRSLDPKTHAPSSVPQEMTLLERWLGLLPPRAALVDAHNNIYDTYNLIDHAYDATQFVSYGLDNIIRGMAQTQIPDFKSGVQGLLRHMDFNLMEPNNNSSFDLVAWMIQHERERGLPTYNEFMRGYKGKVPCPPKEEFEDFSSSPTHVKHLKRLYRRPEDVDLMVGVELDEEMYPGTHIPRSLMIVNFHTMSVLASQDRFALQYARFHCFTKGRPWDCKPTNFLEELLWQPVQYPEPFDKWFPNARWWNAFWMKELDIENNGNNILHNLIMDNTDINCIQRNPFFAPHVDKNPILCRDKAKRLVERKYGSYTLEEIYEKSGWTKDGKRPQLDQLPQGHSVYHEHFAIGHNEPGHYHDHGHDHDHHDHDHHDHGHDDQSHGHDHHAHEQHQH